MPPPLSRAELRLGTVCRIYGALCLVGAFVFAFLPGASYRLASLGGTPFPGAETLFWNALAASSMAAVGVACLVTARNPRAMRHALLPAIAAKAVASGLGFAHMSAGRALSMLAWVDLAVFALLLLIYRASAPGVHAARHAPEKPATEEEAQRAPVQLGVPK